MLQCTVSESTVFCGLCTFLDRSGRVSSLRLLCMISSSS